MKIMVELSFM